MGKVQVAAFMTAGRYESARARNQIETAFREAGIPLVVSLGVYYHQCMQQMLHDCITKAERIDYLLTVDGDTFCTGQDILRVIHGCQHYGWDAVAGIQSKRGANQLLAGVHETKTVTFGNEPIGVDTAHFGLTCITAAKLRAMPLPWFMAVAADDGSFGEGRVDADIYFWQKWKQIGNTVAIHPRVKIGHMEEMIAVYDDEMQLQHVFPDDWEKNYANR